MVFIFLQFKKKYNHCAGDSHDSWADAFFFISPPGQIFLTTMGKEKKKGIAEKIGQLQPNRSFPLTFVFFFVTYFFISWLEQGWSP